MSMYRTLSAKEPENYNDMLLFFKCALYTGLVNKEVAKLYLLNPKISNQMNLKQLLYTMDENLEPFVKALNVINYGLLQDLYDKLGKKKRQLIIKINNANLKENHYKDMVKVQKACNAQGIEFDF